MTKSTEGKLVQNARPQAEITKSLVGNQEKVSDLLKGNCLNLPKQQNLQSDDKLTNLAKTQSDIACIPSIRAWCKMVNLI